MKSADRRKGEMISAEDLLELHRLEHVLWGKGHDGPEYVKKEWSKLDVLISRVCTEIYGQGWLTKAQKAVEQKT